MMITLPFPFSSRRALCAVAATLFGLAVSAAAPAATLTVNSADDGQAPGGVCTLRGAVGAVNGGADANGCIADIGVNAYGADDTIVFDTSVSGIITFTSGQITISKNLILTGPGATILALDGNGTNRLFYVNGGTALTVAGLTLQNGNAGNGDGGAIEVGVGGHALTVRDSVFSGNTAYAGGAIDISYSSSTLAVENCSFAGNTAAAASGGAIWAVNNATVSASTFAGNTANYGGAIWAVNNATVSASTFTGNTAGWGGAIGANTATISASTFSGNTAAGDGGALWAAGATIDASTFIGNTATNEGGAIGANNLNGNGLTLVNNTAPFGATVFIIGGSGTLYNSLIAGGATVATAHCAVAGGGTISGDTNLEWRDGSDETSCGSTAPVSAAGASSLTAIVADTLADNGGPTQTLALPLGSPALGAADPSSVPPPTATDQRGIARDATPDLGAFELGTLTIAGTLPNGDVGQAYNGRVSANGTYGPYTYAVTTGSLPPGLVLDSATGVATGTPTTAGNYSFTITVTDALGAIASEDFTVAIMEALSLSGTLSGGDVGQTYSGSVSASGGTAPYTYTVTTGSLPPGLALNSTTGAVTGTPTTAGSYTFTITVQDSGSPASTASSSFTVTILGGPPPGATAIPALGPLALLALAGLLGGVGVMRRRK